ncbi:MAG: FKBP-type peptidyl-prolyl cis-trans isomerase [Candidatus Eisenbacteria bacterium]|uniref:Peptidyl-prolyl cis-trans isomerase n=1 Tax=Eiseniibacteriota bacterium TaxID=2212470 RepID=A0A9D6L7P7_UNCEI|nr:FKBP-type peptidyl-prolyl cis-trans isomerase [Candidatus Eisenbacteria bacterium]
MSANPRWLAVTAIVLVLGCNQSKSGESNPTGGSSGSSATTASGASGAHGAVTSTETGMGAGATATAQTTTPSAPAGEVTMPNGLKYQDLTVGTGAEAAAGKKVRVHYTGWLTNGTKFDSSVDRNSPFEFTLGAHEVISGWDQCVAGMKVGGKRKLTIPPELGYGAAGTPGGPIPPNATLLFDVELLDVK